MTPTIKRFGLVLVWLLWASGVEAANRCAPSAVPPAAYGACTTSYGSIQLALNAAATVSGDIVWLHAGTVYTESVQLPNKGTLASNIIVRSDCADASLPATGIRTGPAYASCMAKIKSPGGGSPALYTAPGASNYTIQHVEAPFVPQAFYDIIKLGDGSSAQYLKSQEPHDIILDQMYIHGDPVAGQKRAIALDGRNLTVRNSYISDIHGVAQDTLAIGGYNGSGNYTITNNYIEAASYGVMFGGADPFVRTRWTVAGSATTTSASVTIVESGHNCNEVASGYPIAVEVSTNVVEFVTLTATPSAGTTCTLAWTPALSTVPAVGMRVRWDSVPDTILIEGNHIAKQVSWATGPLAKPILPAPIASTAGGTLPAGTYYYRVQAFSINGYNGMTVYSDVSDEQSVTLSATGTITLDWADGAGETGWRIWRYTTPGATSGVFTETVADTLVDEGTKTYTTATTTAGSRFSIKNNAEIKVGVNVTIRNNIFDYSWAGAATGYQLWLKAVNQDGGCWTCRTINLLVENNQLRHGCGAIAISGQESYSGNPGPMPMTGTVIRHNLVYDNRLASCLTGGGPFQMVLVGHTVNLTIEHMTIAYDMGPETGGILNMDGTHTGFIFRNNMVPRGGYGFIAPGKLCNDAIAQIFPTGATITNNAFGGLSATNCPINNFYPTLTDWQNSFVAYTLSGDNADYHLKSTSPYKNAGTDGTDLGANITTVLANTANVVQGVSTNPPIITTTSLPNDLIATTYPPTTLQATGGATPLTWTCCATGSLPPGVTLSTAGVVSGTSTTAGTYAFRVTVTDSTAGTPLTDTQDYTVSIFAATNITSGTLPGATVQNPYTPVSLPLTGDQAPYVWAVTVGSLPAGITMNTSTGVFSGTPTAVGTSSFTVSATGSLGSFDTQASSIVVSPEPTIPNRPAVFGTTARVTVGCVTPTAGVRRGDLHIQTCASTPAIQTASVGYPSTPVWVAATGGATVSASDITTGQFRLAEFPNLFPPAVTFATSVTSPLGSFDYTQMAKRACDTLSTNGYYRFCVGTDGQLQSSVDGGTYRPVGGYGLDANNKFGSTTAVGTAWMTNGVDRIIVDANGDTHLTTGSLGELEARFYGSSVLNGITQAWQMGTTNAITRRLQMLSLQGTRRQAWLFADTNNEFDYFTAFGSSSDSGGVWQRWWGIKQSGEVTMLKLQLESLTVPTCNSGTRGMIIYTAGGAGVADQMQACRKNAADVYAWVPWGTAF